MTFAVVALPDTALVFLSRPHMNPICVEDFGDRWERVLATVITAEDAWVMHSAPQRAQEGQEEGSAAEAALPESECEGLDCLCQEDECSEAEA
jgi:hypothetical protein